MKMSKRTSTTLVMAAALAISLAACKKSGADAERVSGPAASASASAAPAAPSPVGKAPEIDGTVAEILDAYQKTPGAKARYRGKLALVFGAIGETGKEEGKGRFVVFPKNPDEPSKEAPKIRCLLKSGEEAALGEKGRGDKIDAAGLLDEEDGGSLVLRDCVIETQMRVCRALSESLKRGTCEANKEKLGARLMIGSEPVEIACTSNAGFEAFTKEWASVPKEQQTKTKAAVDTTACRAVPESVNPRLIVDLTAALARIRWVDGAPVLSN